MICRVSMVLTMLALTTIADTVGAQTDFRVETDLFHGDDKKPFHLTVTLFSDGVAYDLPRDPKGVITMVDPKRARIILFDPSREIQSLVQLNELKQLISNAQQGANGVLAKIIRDAKVVPSEKSDELSVGEALISYEATLQQPGANEDVAIQYAIFADAVAMLNGRDPAALPYHRLVLNQAIADKKLLPKEIKKTVKLGKRPQVNRSILHLNTVLSKDDKAKINDIGIMLATYKLTTQKEFFSPAKVAQVPANLPK